MAVIDIHTHAFPEKIAARTIATLEGGAGMRAYGGGTIDDLLASMDSAGVDKSVVCNIATKPEQFDNILAWCAEIRSDRIEPFASVHPDTADAGAAVERVAGAGLLGIKLHPMYQEFSLTDSRLDPILAAARDCGLIVMLHAGFDIAFRHDARAHPADVRKLADRWGGLKLICAHLGGWEAWQEATEHLLGSEVYIDTSMATQYMPPAHVAELIARHDPRRVLFGTDWPWGGQDEDLAGLARCGLSDDALERILYQNAADLLAGG